MDANEEIISISPASWLVKTLIGVVAFGGGVTIGYILGSRRGDGRHDDPSKQYWDLTADQLQERADMARDLEQMKAKREEPPPHEKVVIDEEAYYHLHPVDDPDEGRVVAVIDGGTKEEIPVDQYLADKASRDGSEGFNQDSNAVAEGSYDRNIFAADPASQGWDYEKEIASRSPDAPYVLHTDEFAENAMEFHQIDLTWYEGDQTLVEDLAEKQIHNWRQFLPDPLPFGWGSGDDLVVYIQNEERKTAYSITKDDRSWAEMQGYEPDLDDVQHSSTPKFRLEG